MQVTRHLTAADLLDESKAGSIDFPESVVGLFRGDLGFPHRGFPAEVEKAVLRGGLMGEKRTERAGLTLPPEDLEAKRQELAELHGRPFSAEETMSSLLYPKVFADFLAKQKKAGGGLLRLLPTPVYLHGLAPGLSFTLPAVPGPLLADLLHPSSADSSSPESVSSVTVTLDRVAPLKQGHRELTFRVQAGGEVQVQVARVKDSTGAFVFAGAMADAASPGQLGSPMPGVIEKVIHMDTPHSCIFPHAQCLPLISLCYALSLFYVLS